jgi:hypothetical protein
VSGGAFEVNWSFVSKNRVKFGYSIYMNDEQIAWWEQSAVAFGKGDTYNMLANNDGNIVLLISFCLILDDSQNNDSDSSMTINLGNFGPQAKKFNPNWHPKS